MDSKGKKDPKEPKTKFVPIFKDGEWPTDRDNIQAKAVKLARSNPEKFCPLYTSGKKHPETSNRLFG